MGNNNHLTVSAITPPRRAQARQPEFMRQSGDRSGPGGSTADNRQLAHERQVQQIELELQNEDLRQSRDEMKAGLEKYSELYDFAPVGYLTLDRESAISEANLSAASLLEVPRAPLGKNRFVSFVAPSDRATFHAFLRQVFASKSRKECEVRLVVNGKAPVDVRLKANLFATGRACRMAIIDVTAQKIAEAVTAELAAIVTSSNDAIIGRDLDGTITSWNAGAERIFGYTAQEMLGRPILRLIPPDLRAAEATMMSQIQQSASAAHYEAVRLAKDGRRLYMSVTNSPIRQADGRISGISKVARDITEQKRAADRVLVSELRYRRLFEAAQDGILILDPRTRKITDANPFIIQVLGYTREQLIGKELWEIGLLKDETSSQAAFRKLKKYGFIRYEDLPLETQGGQRREVEFVSNLYNEGGETVIQCNIRDITERKHAEQALQASEERYRTLFSSIDEGYCVIEMIFDRRGKPVDYRYLEVNPAFQKQTGLVKPIGKRVRELVPGIEKHWIDFYGKVSLTGKAVRFVNEAKAMGGRWFDGYACPVGGPGSGKVAIIFNDITERRKVENSLRTAREELTQHASMLERTVTARTIELIATNQQLSASLDSTRLGEKQNRVLLFESQVMQRKLRQLTHQILTAQEEERKKISRELHDEVVQTLVGINVELSGLVQGDAPDIKSLKARIARTQRLVQGSVEAVHRFARDLRPAVLDDLGLIPALLSYCKNLAARKKLQIQLSVFREVEQLESDSLTVLFRVSQEALTNVARHAQATKVHFTISKLAQTVRLEIRDNGKSFPVRKVLSAKSNRLGLVGMRERVEMIGGSLTIESAAGQGTTVRAEIPFTPSKNTK